MQNTTITTDEANGTSGNQQAAVRWLLRVRGPVLVDIEDSEGHHVGPIREAEFRSHARRHYSKVADAYHIWEESEEEEKKEQAQDKRCLRQIPDFPNLFELAIPNVMYNPGRTFSWISLGQPGHYSFRLLGRTAGTVDIYWTGFSDTERLNTTYFHAIPMTAGDTASFDYNTIDPAELLVTFVNSAGTEKRTITPTAILLPIESRDDTPPITSITVNGNQAHVSATDNEGGSGVLHTLYTTDMRTFLTFIPPFAAPVPPDARIIMAFSIDRNGNREYPGAVLPILGLSQTRFVFRATEGDQLIPSQRLQVINRDPVPLTGPLQWTAEGVIVSWLRFEPAAGQTPGVINLSVQIAGLKPGTYSGILVISSPSPEVVFARQMVEVELLVEAGPASQGGIQCHSRPIFVTLPILLSLSCSRCP